VQYVSTRGRNTPQGFCDTLLEGLAPDGGLTVPESYPRIDKVQLASWRHLGYRELALQILRLYATDIPEAVLKGLIDRTYTAAVFGSEDITPVVTLESGLHLLQLSNGPTLAFKDVAMQLLGSLFEYVLDQRAETLNILGATSGDTGSAAEYAMRGRRGIRVFMLSPYQKMSAFQTAQMFSLHDPNIYNIAIRGVFDDCQDIVKAVSNDPSFKAKHRIGTVNSINWARLLAQVVYYFKAYFAVTTSNDQRVSFAVPSGNFGNVCAGHVARQMGLPIAELIVATNENDVLEEFFRTGLYRPRSAQQVQQTSSPSMDISKASNFERFIFDLIGRDGALLTSLWGQAATTGAFDLRETPFFAKIASFGFVAGKSTHQDRLETICNIWHRYGRIVDPHTADGVKVGLEYRDPSVPLICLETAQPVKFEATIQEAIGRAPARPPSYANIEALPQRFEIMNAEVTAVKRFIAERTGA
jgi:threonine synthase